MPSPSPSQAETLRTSDEAREVGLPAGVPELAEAVDRPRRRTDAPHAHELLDARQSATALDRRRRRASSADVDALPRTTPSPRRIAQVLAARLDDLAAGSRSRTASERAGRRAAPSRTSRRSRVGEGDGQRLSGWTSRACALDVVARAANAVMPPREPAREHPAHERARRRQQQRQAEQVGEEARA